MPAAGRLVTMRCRFLYGFFTVGRGSMASLSTEEAVMDIWYIGLWVVLAALTWGGIVLCDRLLGRP
jgi:hypothetical protein